MTYHSGRGMSTLDMLLMDEFDEMERQVDVHARSCPNRDDEVTQSCDLRTAWDVLQAAVVSDSGRPQVPPKDESR